MYGPIGPPKPSIQQTAGKRKQKIGCQRLFPTGKAYKLQLSLDQQVSDFQQILTLSVIQLRDLLRRLHQIRHHHGHAAAARPARTPLKLSSSTRQSCGSRCSFFAATKRCRVRACCGRPPYRRQHRGNTAPCRWSANSSRSYSAGSSWPQCAAGPCPPVRPAAPSDPFCRVRPGQKRSSASCQILSSTFCGSPGMYSATWRRRLSPARPRPRPETSPYPRAAAAPARRTRVPTGYPTGARCQTSARPYPKITPFTIGVILSRNIIFSIVPQFRT